MAGEVEDTKKGLSALMRHLADELDEGRIEPKAFSSLGGIVVKSHGTLKVNIPSGKNQFMLVYEKP
ncbi:MAG: hypothetical protein DRQ64_00335 [Gammaproteobacteria bacterium]|nr:MAG: hypothetical protein DRQ64_00335 [Gammaproteobacteria bacterium]